MRRTFVTWSGASAGVFGPWIPIFRSRKKIDSRLSIRLLALAAPNGVSSATPPYEIQLRYLTTTDRQITPAEGAVGPLTARRLDTADVMAGSIVACTVNAANRVSISRQEPEGRGVLSESDQFAVSLEASRREDAAGRTLWLRLAHAGQHEEAPWGGSALVRIVVDERLEVPDGQERSFTLYHNPVLCEATLTLSPEILARTSIGLKADGSNPVAILADGKPVETMVGKLVEVAGETVRVMTLPDSAPPSFRHSRVVMTLGRSRPSAGCSFPAPSLSWSVLGKLEPFARFAEKTGWLRSWRPRTLEANATWQLAGGDTSEETQLGGAQYLVARGAGEWSLVNDSRLPFASPCLLGFVHVLPDSLDDHRERFLRWKRQWTAWHDSDEVVHQGGVNAPLAPWFEAGFPLLGRTAAATAGSGGVELMECPYSADLFKHFRETWIVDELHEVTRWAMGGWRVWDTMLGTLQSRGSHVFSALHPSVVDVRRHGDQRRRHWPLPFGEQVPIVIPVTSERVVKEIWKHRDSTPVVAPEVAEWTQGVSQEARTLHRNPAGWLIRQGAPPPGMMMVPTGFALLLQNPGDSFDDTTVIESAYRTPRLFGELEVDREGMLPAVSSVLVLSESNERATTPSVAPLSLSLAFTVTQKELFGMMGDLEHGGQQLRTALNIRIREVARTGRRHALFFSKNALGSMREWLYHEWRRLGGPRGDPTSFPISKLLVAAILARGTPLAELRVDSRWRAWTKKDLRRALVKEKIILREGLGGGVTDYSRVHFDEVPLNGEWERRFRREGHDRSQPRLRGEALDRSLGGVAADAPRPIEVERAERPLQ